MQSKMNQTEKFCLKWNDFKNNVSQSFTKLRKESHFFDVTLVSEDHKQIKAHKLVLSACSDFFKAILSENSHSHPMLYIDGVTSEQMQQVLDYIYQGEVNVFQEDLDKFLSIAQKLKLEGLMGAPEDDPPETKNVSKNEEIYTNYKDINESSSFDEKIFSLNDTKTTSKAFNGSFALKTTTDTINVQSNDEVNSKFEEMVVKEDGMFRCNHCNRTMSHRGSMKRHVETHLSGLAYDCQNCGKTFRSSRALNHHKC